MNFYIIIGRTDLKDDTLLSIIDHIEEDIEKTESHNDSTTERENDEILESIIQIKHNALQSRVPQRYVNVDNDDHDHDDHEDDDHGHNGGQDNEDHNHDCGMYKIDSYFSSATLSLIFSIFAWFYDGKK